MPERTRASLADAYTFARSMRCDNCTNGHTASHNPGMLYPLLANAVLVIHLAFIAFVLFGGLAVLRWPRLAWVHVPAAVWGVLIEFAGWICPLTPLENSFRERGGQSGYSGGFIDHYITGLIYPEGLTRTMQFGIGALVLAINGYVYWRLWRRGGRNSE